MIVKYSVTIVTILSPAGFRFGKFLPDVGEASMYAHGHGIGKILGEIPEFADVPLMNGETKTEQNRPGLSFGERLSGLMRERKMKPATLAREIGISHVAVKNYLEGRVPDTRSLFQLSRYFGVSMEYLLNGTLVAKTPGESGGEKVPGEAPKTLQEGLLSVMNYEFRSPLHGVIGFTDLLSRTSLTKEQRQYLEMISGSGDALLGKLENILEMVKGSPPDLGLEEGGNHEEASAGESFQFRTLVVEDDITARWLLLKMLKTMGISADHAKDGPDCIEMSKQSSYELIFMDVRMPGMDGLEVTRRIREAEKGPGDSAYIVAITAQAMPGDREQCLIAGMNDYLSKPIRRSDILRVLSARAAMAKKS